MDSLYLNAKTSVTSEIDEMVCSFPKKLPPTTLQEHNVKRKWKLDAKISQ